MYNKSLPSYAQGALDDKQQTSILPGKMWPPAFAQELRQGRSAVFTLFQEGLRLLNSRVRLI